MWLYTFAAAVGLILTLMWNTFLSNPFWTFLIPKHDVLCINWSAPVKFKLNVVKWSIYIALIHEKFSKCPT